MTNNHVSKEYAEKIGHLFSDAEYWWQEVVPPSEYAIKGYWVIKDEYDHHKIPAPTIAELLKVLPNEIIIKNNLPCISIYDMKTNYTLIIRKNKDSYGVSYQAIATRIQKDNIRGIKYDYFIDYYYATCSECFPDALAMMIEHLNTKGLL